MDFLGEFKRYPGESPELSILFLKRATPTSVPLSCLLWVQEE